MSKHTLTHLSDAVLLRDLVALVSRDRATTAELLAHLAEVDVRRLYAPAGYPSMFAYCIEELRLSEDAAYRRIRAARAARQFPALFSAIEDGRLHLAAVSLLAPHLTSDNVQELIEAATHRRKIELEEFLGRRFPAWSLPPRDFSSIRPFPQFGSAADRVHGRLPLQDLLGSESLTANGPKSEQVAPERVVSGIAAGPETKSGELVPGRVAGALEDGPLANAQVLVPGRVDGARCEAPARPERYLVQVTISKSTHDKLRRIQLLLSHAVPSGDVAQVLDRALDALLEKLETRKLGRRSPRSMRQRTTHTQEGSDRGRYIPTHIRRAVWERDQGRCTFVNASGSRCTARRFLEFDHIRPFARGGRASVEGLRLRCQAHNLLEAERAFGAKFMMEKRARARRDREERVRAARAHETAARAHETAAGAHETAAGAHERARMDCASERDRGISRGPRSGSS